MQSPYQAQVQLIRSRLQDLAATAAGASAAEAMATPGESQGTGWPARHAVLEGAAEVEVATVDSFQGREAEAVVISMVRAWPQGLLSRANE